LEEHKRKHTELLGRKEAIDAKLAQVDKASGTFVAHQIDQYRANIAELSSTLETKREYQKRIRAKLMAYKEIAELVKQAGGGEQQIKDLLAKQE
jgi:ABC-type transporter Mla subunit MlaD